MVKTIDSEQLKTKSLRVQRWEDEGGQMIEDNDSSPAPIHARKRVPSLQWNEGFVIVPVQPGHGMILIREKQAKQPNP